MGTRNRLSNMSSSVCKVPIRRRDQREDLKMILWNYRAFSSEDRFKRNAHKRYDYIIHFQCARGNTLIPFGTQVGRIQSKGWTCFIRGEFMKWRLILNSVFTRDC